MEFLVASGGELIKHSGSQHNGTCGTIDNFLSSWLASYCINQVGKLSSVTN